MTFKWTNKRIFLFIESLRWWTQSNSNRLDEHWDQSPSAPPGKRLLGWRKSKSMPYCHQFITFAMFNVQLWGFCHCCPLPVSCGCRRSSPRSWNRFPERLSKDQETTADQHWKVVELGFRSKGVAKVTPGCVLELHSVGGCKKNGKEQWNLIPAHLLRCFGFY